MTDTTIMGTVAATSGPIVPLVRRGENCTILAVTTGRMDVTTERPDVTTAR